MRVVVTNSFQIYLCGGNYKNRLHCIHTITLQSSSLKWTLIWCIKRQLSWSFQKRSASKNKCGSPPPPHRLALVPRVKSTAEVKVIFESENKYELNVWQRLKEEKPTLMYVCTYMQVRGRFLSASCGSSISSICRAVHINGGLIP